MFLAQGICSIISGETRCVSGNYISLYMLSNKTCIYHGNKNYIGTVSNKEPDKHFLADKRPRTVNIMSRGHP